MDSIFETEFTFDRIDMSKLEYKQEIDTYKLFCIKTTLENYVKHKYNLKGVSFKNIKNDTQYTMNVVINSKSSKEIHDDIQNFIDKINTNYCLLFSLNDFEYDKNWILDILKLSNYDLDINNDNIYLNLSNELLYNEKYNEISIKLYKLIVENYEKGMIKCSPEFAKTWNLTNYTKDYYYPEWKTFIIKYWDLFKDIQIINILPNIYVNHYLMKYVNNKFVINYNKLYIKIIDYDNLKHIEEVLNSDFKKIYIKETPSFESGYQIIDSEYPYMKSVEISLNKK